MAANLKIVGFDFEPETLEYLESGQMQAVHVQRQYHMGYLGVVLPYAIHVLGLEETKRIAAPHMVGDSHIDTGLDVITPEDLEEYNAYLDTLGVD